MRDPNALHVCPQGGLNPERRIFEDQNLGRTDGVEFAGGKLENLRIGFGNWNLKISKNNCFVKSF